MLVISILYADLDELGWMDGMVVLQNVCPLHNLQAKLCISLALNVQQCMTNIYYSVYISV